MSFDELVPYAGIVVICYCAGGFIKNSKIFKEIDNSLIPYIVGLLGGLLGFFMRIAGIGIVDCNLIDSIAIGMISGFSSTGIHQTAKGLMLLGKKNEE